MLESLRNGDIDGQVPLESRSWGVCRVLTMSLLLLRDNALSFNNEIAY